MHWEQLRLTRVFICSCCHGGGDPPGVHGRLREDLGCCCHGTCGAVQPPQQQPPGGPGLLELQQYPHSLFNGLKTI